MATTHVAVFYYEVRVQKAGCILPGTQQRVGQQKIKGIKSEGKICSAYDVGWLGKPTEELLLLEESWGVISGDICPMAPPSVCSCIIITHCMHSLFMLLEHSIAGSLGLVHFGFATGLIQSEPERAQISSITLDIHWEGSESAGDFIHFTVALHVSFDSPEQPSSWMVSHHVGSSFLCMRLELRRV